MPIKPDYTIHGDKCHYGWNRSIEPVVKVSPGSILEIEAVDAGGGQITSDSTLEDVKNIDFDRVNPVTGPVYVDGVEPGDALKVTILSLKPSGWGWSAVIPGLARRRWWKKYSDRYLKKVATSYRGNSTS